MSHKIKILIFLTQHYREITLKKQPHNSVIIKLNFQSPNDGERFVKTLTLFTSQVPDLQGAVMTACDHLGRLPEEFGSHHLATVARQSVLQHDISLLAFQPC